LSMNVEMRKLHFGIKNLSTNLLKLNFKNGNVDNKWKRKKLKFRTQNQHLS
jgi:hypothetical protein